MGLMGERAVVAYLVRRAGARSFINLVHSQSSQKKKPSALSERLLTGFPPFLLGLGAIPTFSSKKAK